MLITLMIYIIAVVRLEQGEFNMTLGDYMAFVYALNSFVQSTFGIFGYYFELMAITPTWNQAKEILEVPPESTYVANSIVPLKGDITLDHVDFAYQEDRPILNGIDLAIKPGEFVGIVGPTGCGKSTLIRLLLGLEVPSKGAVRYDGKELDEWDLKDLRGQIGCVLQNTTIFEGSILENIMAGRRIDEKKIAEVIKMAGIAEFIEELPMGLHTAMSYGGSTISLGQKQRILIARALVNDPKVILFDEATSALDNETQKVISDHLAERKVTRIVVAHRPVTLKHADRILTIQDGKMG
jgi:ABC-type bacteriocin/lantibiotic exporter with double-glycine peptidase domain